MTNFEDDGKTDGVNVFDFKHLGKLKCFSIENCNYMFYFIEDPDVQELINSAIEVRKRAYCPYSGEYLFCFKIISYEMNGLKQICARTLSLGLLG